MAMQDFDLETGKKQIYELMCNELYVPMKRKELAALCRCQESGEMTCSSA